MGLRFPFPFPSSGAAKQAKHENNSEKIVRTDRWTDGEKDGKAEGRKTKPTVEFAAKSFGIALPLMEADYRHDTKLFLAGSYVKS